MAFSKVWFRIVLLYACFVHIGGFRLPHLQSSRRKALRESEDNSDQPVSFFKDPKYVERSKHWIVIVDDDEPTRMAVGDYLYDQGFEVTACADAEALLKVCRDPFQYSPAPRLPSAIVSDVRMPGKDGITLLKELQEDTRLNRIPVILLTAKAMTQDRIEGYSAGADAYIPKPFDPAELVAILDNKVKSKQDVGGGASTSGDYAALQQELQQIKALVTNTREQGDGMAQVADLTPTEREVLSLLCEGMTNKEIAATRGTGAPQVSRTLNQLFSKTSTKSRTELVRWATKTGLAKPNT